MDNLGRDVFRGIPFDGKPAEVWDMALHEEGMNAMHYGLSSGINGCMYC